MYINFQPLVVQYPSYPPAKMLCAYCLCSLLVRLDSSSACFCYRWFFSIFSFVFLNSISIRSTSSFSRLFSSFIFLTSSFILMRVDDLFPPKKGAILSIYDHLFFVGVKWFKTLFKVFKKKFFFHSCFIFRIFYLQNIEHQVMI